MHNTTLRFWLVISFFFAYTTALAQSVIVTTHWPKASTVAPLSWPVSTATPDQTSKIDLAPAIFMAQPMQETQPIVSKPKQLTKKVIKTKKATIPLVALVHSQRYFALPSASGVNITGSMNYQITVGGKSNFMTVRGNSVLLAALRYKIKNGILYLYYQVQHTPTHTHLPKQPIQVELHLAKLNTLQQTGSSNVMVTGIVPVSKIDFSGSGNLKLYWVNSEKLTIRTYGSGTVSLAGVAKVVNACAYDTSHLNMRYLRVGTLFVKSYYDANVDVWPENDLYAVAYNNSNIYYYHQPDYMSRLMKQSATILPMWTIPTAILGFNVTGF